MNKRDKTRLMIILAIGGGICSILCISFQWKTFSAVQEPRGETIYTRVAATVNQFATSYPSTIESELTRIEEENKLTPVSTARVTAKNWLSMFLASPTCMPPCWENIYPGHTTLSEGIRILSNIEGVEFNWLYLTPGVISKTSFARWEFDSTNWGQVVTEANTDIITTIELYPDDEQGISLDRVITYFGSPESIVRVCNPSWCSYAAVFVNIGMVVYLDISTDEKPITLTEDTLIEVITFSPPKAITVFEREYESSNKVMWEGYVSYSFPDEK